MLSQRLTTLSHQAVIVIFFFSTPLATGPSASSTVAAGNLPQPRVANHHVFARCHQRPSGTAYRTINHLPVSYWYWGPLPPLCPWQQQDRIFDLICVKQGGKKQVLDTRPTSTQVQYVIDVSKRHHDIINDQCRADISLTSSLIIFSRAVNIRGKPKKGKLQKVVENSKYSCIKTDID